ncbi:MAG: hypothetical protein RMM58_14050 [Chloroflexota bacterium]|nr:hypothetical protein [Dehalococcoidia bacterium]MDW8254995.1 hypothetical protein [Chloroflexota bacterium]
MERTQAGWRPRTTLQLPGAPAVGRGARRSALAECKPSFLAVMAGGLAGRGGSVVRGPAITRVIAASGVFRTGGAAGARKSNFIFSGALGAPIAHPVVNSRPESSPNAGGIAAAAVRTRLLSGGAVRFTQGSTAGAAVGRGTDSSGASARNQRGAYWLTRRQRVERAAEGEVAVSRGAFLSPCSASRPVARGQRSGRR